MFLRAGLLLILFLGIVFTNTFTINSEQFTEEALGHTSSTQDGEGKSPQADIGTRCNLYSDHRDFFSCLIRENNIPYSEYVLIELIKHESNWKETALTPVSGAAGLGQVLNSTWEATGCQGEPLRGKDNLVCVSKLLSQHNGIRHYCADWRTSVKLNTLEAGICLPEWVDPRSLVYK